MSNPKKSDPAGLPAEFWTFLGDIWLPAALVLIVWLLVTRIDAIALAFKNAPFVRKLKIYGVEIEIDPKALEDLEEREKEVFQRLSKKAERASSRVARSLSLDEHLRDAASAIMKLRRRRYGELRERQTIRFTIHVPDAIFKNHLYQLVEYHIWPSGGSQPGKGRRFSTRYGIIGLAWRTKKSQGTANAFRGDSTAVEELKVRWSMTDAEAEAAKSKPSCLAIALGGRKPEAELGLLYADCTEEKFWGEDDDETQAFAANCENLTPVKHLREAMTEYHVFLNQVRIDLDLTSL
jgi:hypothetical protein